MGKFRRLFFFVKECLVRTKSGHSELLDWAPLASCFLIAFSPLITAYLLPEEASLKAFKVWMSANGWYVSIIGIGATVVVAFWHSFCQWDELNEKQKPCIELSECAPQDADGGKGRVFLLGVKNKSANDIEQCSVRLINIKTKTRDVPCNDALTFQPSEREPSTERTIHPDDLNVIDVIFLFPGTLETVRPGTKVNGLVHAWNKSETFRSYFTEHGPYILSVAITGKHFKTRIPDLRFTYGGNMGMLEVLPPLLTSE